MRRLALQLTGFAGVVVAIQLAASLSGNVYHLTQLRITSYNVCYTKLLRTW